MEFELEGALKKIVACDHGGAWNGDRGARCGDRSMASRSRSHRYADLLARRDSLVDDQRNRNAIEDDADQACWHERSD